MRLPSSEVITRTGDWGLRVSAGIFQQQERDGTCRSCVDGDVLRGKRTEEEDTECLRRLAFVCFRLDYGPLRQRLLISLRQTLCLHNKGWRSKRNDKCCCCCCCWVTPSLLAHFGASSNLLDECWPERKILCTRKTIDACIRKGKGSY